jgi:hypothetical protein
VRPKGSLSGSKPGGSDTVKDTVKDTNGGPLNKIQARILESMKANPIR